MLERYFVSRRRSTHPRKLVSSRDRTLLRLATIIPKSATLNGWHHRVMPSGTFTGECRYCVSLLSSPIRERTRAGRLRYKQDFDAGRVGKTVYSKSRKNLAIARPKRIFNWECVIELRQRGASIRAIAKQLGVGVGTVTRMLLERSKISSRKLETRAGVNMSVYPGSEPGLNFPAAPRTGFLARLAACATPSHQMAAQLDCASKAVFAACIFSILNLWTAIHYSVLYGLLGG